MQAIIKRELHSYFHNMFLYGMAAALMLYAGLYLGDVLFSQEIGSVRAVYTEIVYILLLFIPFPKKRTRGRTGCCFPRACACRA